jgi:hypothetical protein
MIKHDCLGAAARFPWRQQQPAEDGGTPVGGSSLDAADAGRAGACWRHFYCWVCHWPGAPPEHCRPRRGRPAAEGRLLRASGGCARIPDCRPLVGAHTRIHTRTNTRTHTHIYIYIYKYKYMPNRRPGPHAAGHPMRHSRRNRAAPLLTRYIRGPPPAARPSRAQSGGGAGAGAGPDGPQAGLAGSADKVLYSMGAGGAASPACPGGFQAGLPSTTAMRARPQDQQPRSGSKTVQAAGARGGPRVVIGLPRLGV